MEKPTRNFPYFIYQYENRWIFFNAIGAIDRNFSFYPNCYAYAKTKKGCANEGLDHCFGQDLKSHLPVVEIELLASNGLNDDQDFWLSVAFG